MSFEKPKKIINGYYYFLDSKIGNGCSSQVFQGFQQKTKKPVSIKVVPKIQHKKSSQVEMAEAQIESLQSLKGNSNVLNLLHVIQTKKSIYIITQLCQKGALSKIITKEGKIKEQKAINILEQIINGYRSIYNQEIVHRDIKPCNILINQANQVKIADFGFSLKANLCETPAIENVGSPLYMPYESLLQNIYSFQSDIWAIGITFLEMLLGKTPWKSKTQKQLICELRSFEVDSVLPNKISELSKTFLKKVLVRDLKNRMSPQQLFNFTFRPTNLQNKTLINEQILPKQNYDIQLINKKYSCIQFPRAIQQNNNNLLDNIKNQVEVQQKSTQPDSRNKSSSYSFPQKKEQENRKKIFTNSMLTLQPRREIKMKKIGTSLIELKQLTIKQSNTSLINQSIEVKNKLDLQTQRKILLQIQSQINYFRFLFKLVKKMCEILKTTDLNIMNLKSSILFLVYQKIQEIQNLDRLNFNKLVIQSFKKTGQYINMLKVLTQYKQRYSKQLQKLKIICSFNDEKTFKQILIYTIKVLYQNIIKIQNSQDQLLRKEGLIYLLQDLSHLIRLFNIQRKYNWQQFLEKSQINNLVEKSINKINSKQYWIKIKYQIKQHIK